MIPMSINMSECDIIEVSSTSSEEYDAASLGSDDLDITKQVTTQLLDGNKREHTGFVMEDDKNNNKEVPLHSESIKVCHTNFFQEESLTTPVEDVRISLKNILNLQRQKEASNIDESTLKTKCCDTYETIFGNRSHHLETIPEESSPHEKIEFLERELRYRVFENNKLRHQLRVNAVNKEYFEGEVDKKALEEEKVKKNMQLTFLESEIHVLSCERMKIQESIMSASGEHNRMVVKISEENKQLKDEVTRLQQKISMMSTNIWLSDQTNSTEKEEKAKSQDLKDDSHNLHRKTKSFVESSENQDNLNSSHRTWNVRVISEDWGINRGKLMEYVRKFEGVVDIEFKEDLAVICFDLQYQARIFHKYKQHHFKGSTFIVDEVEEEN